MTRRSSDLGRGEKATRQPREVSRWSLVPRVRTRRRTNGWKGSRSVEPMQDPSLKHLKDQSWHARHGPQSATIWILFRAKGAWGMGVLEGYLRNCGHWKSCITCATHTLDASWHVLDRFGQAELTDGAEVCGVISGAFKLGSCL